MSSSGHHHESQSQKRESRIRVSGGAIKSIPNDLHAALSEQKLLHGYETLWGTMLQASRLGLRILRAQSDEADKIVNSTHKILHNSTTEGAQA